MSVKFEKDTIKQTGGVTGALPAMKSGKHELADEIGVALTGGKGGVGQPGYLAVRDRSIMTESTGSMLMTGAGVPQAAPDEPSPHKDVDIRNTVGTTGASRIVDREGYHKERGLLHISGAQDGSIRSIRQCSAGPCLDQHPSEGLRRPHELESQDPPDPVQ